MLFNSLEFLVFFPIVVTLYFLTSQKYKWLLLLIASYYFYMVWNPIYILLIVGSTILNYFIGLKLDENSTKSFKKKYLYISLILNLGVLFLFKYFNFFSEIFNYIFNLLNLPLTAHKSTLLLPMGISFYTFQALSYTIDVYRGTTKSEKHLGIFALYISFFPQLVAGPIERSDRLLPQFYEKHKFNYYNVTTGLKRMAWGFFKKVVIADRIAVMVNTIYNNPTSYSGFPLIIATVCFGIQIYCDFSGYSDIAIGSARIMGFNLMENFKRPYFSKSISEFWKRWHISLSSWFRDYLYIPLGGNRVKVSRMYFNLFFTFLISGLWHGASWTFVAWGALHGVYLILGRMLKPFRENIVKQIKLDKAPMLHDFIQICITFFLCMFAWIFFRANSIGDALYICKNLFTNLSDTLTFSSIINTISNLGLDNFDLLIVIFSILILLIVSLTQEKFSLNCLISKLPSFVRLFAYYAFVMYLVIFTYVGASEFIYFQF